MSMRPAPTSNPKTVEAQFNELRSANAKHLQASVVQTASLSQSEAKLTMADLTETERAVATLGVDPSALKPIGWMNSAHFECLLQANALDGDLARRLEAYRHVSAGGN